jgi:hypothetical protein
MTKPEKKEQLKKLIAEFLDATDPVMLTEIRNKIFTETERLPMSSNDSHILEDAMYMWSYNSDKYIKDIKNVSARATVIADFDALIHTVDTSLLKN